MNVNYIIIFRKERRISYTSSSLVHQEFLRNRFFLTAACLDSDASCLSGQAAGCQGSPRASRQLSGLPSYHDRTGQAGQHSLCPCCPASNRGATRPSRETPDTVKDSSGSRLAGEQYTYTYRPIFYPNRPGGLSANGIHDLRNKFYCA